MLATSFVPKSPLFLILVFDYAFYLRQQSKADTTIYILKTLIYGTNCIPWSLYLFMNPLRKLENYVRNLTKEYKSGIVHD